MNIVQNAESVSGLKLFVLGLFMFGGALIVLFFGPISEHIADRIVENSQLASLAQVGSRTDRLLDSYAMYSKEENRNRRNSRADEVTKLAMERQQDLLNQIIENPQYVIDNVIPNAIRAELPAQARPYVEEVTSLTGELSVVHMDWFNDNEGHEGVFRYQLTTPTGKKIALSFVNNPPELSSGVQVHARGVLVEGSVEDEIAEMDGAMALQNGNDAVVMYATDGGTNEGVITANGPVVDIMQGAIGEQRTLVLLGKWSDTTSVPWSRSEVDEYVFGTTSDFVRENSYGQAWLVGQTLDWVDVPWTTQECAPFRELHTELVAQAEAGGVDTSQYSRHIIFTPRATCGFAGIATVGGSPSYSWNNGYVDRAVPEHELGHNFGLHHSHALYCDEFTTFGACSSAVYGDSFDTMGSGQYAHYNPVQKERLGWLNYGTAPDILEVTGDGVYTIKPYETQNADTKVIRLTHVVGADGAVSEWIDYNFMRPIGFDKLRHDSISNFSCRSNDPYDGIFGRRVQSNAYVPETDLLNLHTYDSCFYDTYGSTDWLNPVLGTGETFFDPYSGVSVTPTVMSESAIEVDVMFGEPVCNRYNPKITFSSASGGAVPPGGVKYTGLTVENFDTPACAPRTLHFSSILPDGSTATPEDHDFEIYPSTKEYISFQPKAASDATDGNYMVAYAIHDVNDSNASSSGVFSVTVDTALPPPTITDTTPPSVTITDPNDGGLVGKGEVVAVSAAAVDNVGVTKVEIYVAGSLLCTDTTAPYSCAWSVPKGKSRTYGIHAEAYDAKGNLGFSPTVFVTSGSSDTSGGGSPGSGGKCTPGAQKKGEC